MQINEDLKRFLIGIVLVVFSVILFIYPNRSLKSAIYLFASAALILGVYKLIQTYISFRKSNVIDYTALAMGIGSLILSVLVVVVISFFATFLPWILSVYFLYEVITSAYKRFKEQTFTNELILLYGVNIVVAAILVLMPNLANVTTVYLIAIYLLSTGIGYIRKWDFLF